MCPAAPCTPCNVSLRSQCAHWLWQSAPPLDLRRGITDSHDQSADWSRNDTRISSAPVTGRGNPYPCPKAPYLKGGCRPGDSAGRRTSWAGASLLSYLSYPIFRKKQGFPCEFFVIRATSAFFLLPNAPTCSKITLLTVLRVKLRSRSCAMDAHESCQAGNRAALRGIIHVPQGRRLCGFMGRTISFR